MPDHLIPYAWFCMMLMSAIACTSSLLLLMVLVQRAIDRWIRLRGLIGYFQRAMELENEDRRSDR